MNKLIVLIILLILIAFIYLYVFPRFSLFESEEFTRIKKLLPKEALYCPYMLAMGVNLGSERYMKKNWEKIINVIDSGKMPPPGYENIWTESQKNEYVGSLKDWGMHQV